MKDWKITKTIQEMFMIGNMLAVIGRMNYKLKLLPKALKNLKETKKWYNG